MRTFGIEEEFQFLHPATLRPMNVGARVFDRLSTDSEWRGVTHREFLASQVEHSSSVFDRLDDARAALTGFRRLVADEAVAVGAIGASTGTPPDTEPFPTITDVERYHRIVHDMEGVIADHQLSGLHVHVGVPSREHGVIALNAARPWLPLLTALSSNSPFWRGHDTGYDSWRTVLLRRWTTSGPPPSFVDAADYGRRVERLLGIGGTVDLGVIMWDIRLSEHMPTIEFRMADAQLHAETTLLITALCRAFVTHALEAPSARDTAAAASAAVPTELLSAASLHAAHSGMLGRVLDPTTGTLVPAGKCLTRFLRMLEGELSQAGDFDAATETVGRLLTDGIGATRQRAAFDRGGLPQLGRLLATSITADLAHAHEPAEPTDFAVG
ncbi:MAG TPA: YbdK family carboxylate-amine ligase [Agromyces sp.]|nr:YbdK family carboxylate-amine ligase [Agromyces sp.]